MQHEENQVLNLDHITPLAFPSISVSVRQLFEGVSG